jgi:hypothetical protein
MGEEQIFLKTSTPLTLLKAFRMKLISAGATSLDSIFNYTNTSRHYPIFYPLNLAVQLFKTIKKQKLLEKAISTV